MVSPPSLEQKVKMILGVCIATHSDVGSLILKPRIGVRVDRPFVGVCVPAAGPMGEIWHRLQIGY